MSGPKFWTTNEQTDWSFHLHESSMAMNHLHRYTLLHFPWGSSSNAACWSQINRFISFIWKGLGSCLSPSPPLPRVYWWGLSAGTHSFMFFDLLACVAVNGWEAHQVQGGYPGSFVCPTLSESLGWSKCLIALVMWLLWRVLWWMIMQCRFFPMVPELHHRVCRLFGLGV